MASYQHIVKESGDLIIAKEWNNIGVALADLYNKDVNLTGNKSFTGSLSVSGKIGLGVSTPAEKLEIEGNIKINNSLISDGDMSIKAEGSVQIDSSEGLSVGNGLSISGNTQCKENLDVDGPCRLNGTLAVTGGVVCDENLSVAGDLSIAGSSSLKGDLHVKNNTTIDNALSVLKNSNLHGSLHAYENATIDIDLYVKRHTTINGNLHVNGIIYGTLAGGTGGSGGVVSSDLRLKKDISPLENSIAGITALKGVSFKFKKENDRMQLGFIAQEVEKVFPSLVDHDGEGFKRINYIGLIAPLVETVKAQQKRIDELSVICKELQPEVEK